ITRRHADAFGDDAFRFVDESSNVPTAHIHQDSAAQQTIFAGDHRRSHRYTDMGDVSQRDLSTVWSGDEDSRERFNIFAKIPSVPHTDWKALPAFNRKGHILAADRGFD